MSKDNNSRNMERMVKHYLENCNKNNDAKFKSEPELEVRFGTQQKFKSISKIDYKHVVDTLLQNGWKCSDISGKQILRIIPTQLFTKRNDLEKPKENNNEDDKKILLKITMKMTKKKNL